MLGFMQESIRANSAAGSPAQTSRVREGSLVNLTVPEAAEYLRLGERTVRELIARRALKAVRVGRRLILRRQDLDAFLERHVR